jgi:tetratricopeptide (TPR) repeat protein
VTVLLRSGILRLCAGAAGVIASAGVSELEAQRMRVSECKAPSTMAIAFPKSADKAKAADVRDKVWSTFNDFKGGNFCLVANENVDELIKNSNFPVDTVLGPLDLASITVPLRADEVLQFEIVPTGRSVQLKGSIVLGRDRQGFLRDSIPAHEPGESPSLAYKNFLTEVKKVQGMIELANKCFQLTKDEKFTEAEAAGRQALAALPSSNIARICLANALREGKKNPEEVIKLTDEVLAKDPTNMLVLQTQLFSYLDRDDKARYATVGGRIISISSSHPMVEEIIANLAQWKQTEIVVQLLDRALRDDPENLNLLKIQFRIILASDNLTLAQTRGEALARIMAQIDTAGVDTAFVNRMVNAYARDTATEASKQRAAEWLMRGTQKWPDNVEYAMRLAQTLRNLGQTQQAIAEYQRVIKLNPKAPGLRLQIANTYERAGQSDSAYVWIRRAAEQGDDKNQAAGLVLATGLKKLNAAQTSGSIDDWRATIPVLAYADSLNPADKSASFWWGVAAFQVGYGLYKQLADTAASAPKPTCPVAKEAKDLMLLSNEKVRSAPNTNGQVAAQILTGFGQLLPALDALLERLRC